MFTKFHRLRPTEGTVDFDLFLLSSLAAYLTLLVCFEALSVFKEILLVLTVDLVDLFDLELL